MDNLASSTWTTQVQFSLPSPNHGPTRCAQGLQMWSARWTASMVPALAPWSRTRRSTRNSTTPCRTLESGWAVGKGVVEVQPSGRNIQSLEGYPLHTRMTKPTNVAVILWETSTELDIILIFDIPPENRSNRVDFPPTGYLLFAEEGMQGGLSLRLLPQCHRGESHWNHGGDLGSSPKAALGGGNPFFAPPVSSTSTLHHIQQ